MDLLKNYNFLYRLSDFHPGNSSEDLIFTSFLYFVGLWLIEWTAYAIYSLIRSEIFATRRDKSILARHTMDFLSMVLSSVLGYQAFCIVGWDAYNPGLKDAAGVLIARGVGRSYHYIAGAQRLILFHSAYETKNFCDSLIHNDGVIFLLHHLSTFILTIFALNPFLHVYCIFFLGISEISTSILCVLVCFDADHGVAALGKNFPTLMKILGVAFAVCFVFFRVVLWPYVSFEFFQDGLELLRTGTAHKDYVVYTFLACNVGLTLLQFLWLTEIVGTARKLLFSKDASLSIARGDNKKTQ